MSRSMLVDDASQLIGLMLAPIAFDVASWGKPRSKCIGPDAPHGHVAPSLTQISGRCCGQTQHRSDFSLNQLEIDNRSDSTRIDGGIFTAWWPFKYSSICLEKAACPWSHAWSEPRRIHTPTSEAMGSEIVSANDIGDAASHPKAR